MPDGVSSDGLVFVMTVGTTAVENPEIGAPAGGRVQTVLRNEIGNFLRDASTNVAADEYGPLTSVAEWHRIYWTAKHDHFNPLRIRQTAAELTSTKLILQMFAKERPEIRFRDFVLLTSDTAAGRFCGKVLEKVMVEVPEFLPVDASHLHRKTIAGLDARFVNVSEALPAMLRPFREREPKAIVVFNVTGGYKGTAAIIGALAPQERYWLTYVHEKTREAAFLNEKGQIAPKPTGSPFRVL